MALENTNVFPPQLCADIMNSVYYIDSHFGSGTGSLSGL